MRVFLLIALGIVAAFAFIGGNANQPEKAAVTPPKSKSVSPQSPSAEELRQEKLFQRDVEIARRLKASMANPRAFEVVDAVRMKDGTLCLTYRAQNAFGALVVNNAVYADGTLETSGNATFANRWNARCGGKTGENVRHIRQGL